MDRDPGARHGHLTGDGGTHDTPFDGRRALRGSERGRAGAGRRSRRIALRAERRGAEQCRAEERGRPNEVEELTD
jgi:hypothetical protein